MYKFKRLINFLTIVKMLFWTHLAVAQVLFQEAQNTIQFERHLELQSNPIVLSDRYRLAHIDQNEIFYSIDSDTPLILNLFNDVEFRAKLQKPKKLPSGSSFISGSLEQGGHLTFLLHHNGIIRGKIHSPQGTYTLQSERDHFNEVLIQQKDLSNIPGCGSHNDTPNKHSAELSAKKREIPAFAGMTKGAGMTYKSRSKVIEVPSKITEPKDEEITESEAIDPEMTGLKTKEQKSLQTTIQMDPEPIDVLVVYTQRAEDAEGGPEHIKAFIENEIAETNQIFANSGLPHRQFRLAGMEKVDYVQNSVHLGTDLENLSKTSEDNKDYSSLDEVHPMIEKYKADLVHLFVKEHVQFCGMASIYRLSHDNYENTYCEDSNDSALCMFNRRRRRWKAREDGFRFSVSAVECAGVYMFTHEIGHSLGLLHQRPHIEWNNTDLEGGRMALRPYGFGYFHSDLSQQICQYTVMSDRACPSEGIELYHFVPYFSTPDVFFPPPHSSIYYNPSTFKDIPMGVSGDPYTIDLNGPVHAARAVNDIWDIVASLSYSNELEIKAPPLLPLNISNQSTDGNSCNEEDIPSNALSSNLTSQMSFSPEGETQNLMVSFPVPDNCSNISLTASSSHSFINTSIQKIRDGEYELSITASSNDSSCNLRNAQVTVELQGAPGVSPTSISLAQESSNKFCSSISNLALNSTSLNLSRQNTSSSLSLTDGMFEKFTQLGSLNLSNNQLSSFQSAVFHGLDQLTDLNLSYNKFIEIPSSAFSKMPKLEKLNLGYNKITSIHKSAFSDNSKLIHLWLYSNNISSLDPEIFSNLSHLIMLSLSRNHLETLPDFSDNSKLIHLWLYSNNIKNLLSDSFSELTHLRTLNLSNNELGTIPSNTFQNNSNLEYLQLSNNQLTSLPNNIFSELSKLKSLTLSQNQFSTVPNLSDLSNLESLWLHSNQIRSIESNAFAELSNLKYLNISNNPLEEPLPDQICLFIKNVKTVNTNGLDMNILCPNN